MADNTFEQPLSASIQTGLSISEKMVGPAVTASLRNSIGSPVFGAYRGEMALDFVFGKLWSRPGLDLRARSLITVAMLVALGQTGELRIHLLAAIRNGCTVGEIEELIYHACAYAGFPAANTALHVAEDVFRENGLID